MSKKILLLAGDFVEDYEVMVPFQALVMLGHTVHGLQGSRQERRRADAARVLLIGAGNVRTLASGGGVSWKTGISESPSRSRRRSESARALRKPMASSRLRESSRRMPSVSGGRGVGTRTLTRPSRA